MRGVDLAANLERLGRPSRVAIRALWRGERPPEDHVWSVENWTVVAWRGGLVHVQGPGLPTLVALATVLPGGDLPASRATPGEHSVTRPARPSSWERWPTGPAGFSRSAGKAMAQPLRHGARRSPSRPPPGEAWRRWGRVSRPSRS